MEDEAGIKEVVAEKDERTGKEEIFSKVVRAGKRTYFFDVKATRRDDFYLTITESKKRLGKEGKIFYEKHKIFLYKEDFEKFSEGLKTAVEFIDNGKDIPIQSVPSSNTGHTEEKPEFIDNGKDIFLQSVTAPDTEQRIEEKPELIAGEFTNVEFDDLGKK